MSLEIQQIKEQFGDFANKYGPAAIIPAQVTAINEDDTIAVVFSDGVELDDVRLKSVVKSGNKVLLIPTIGSTVMVGKIQNSDEYIVIAVDEISEVVYNIGSAKYSVTSEGFLLQKGNDTLKEILTLIIEAVQPVVVIYGNNPVYLKLQQALNKIENLLR